MACRTSTALPAALARGWSIAVISAAVLSPVPVATDTRLSARRRASSMSAMKAPEPVFTSMTSVSSPAAPFFERMEAVISGIDSTVPVTSRMA